MTDFKPRPTIYNGVQMRSRLEAGFAMWLDELGVEWEYEPSCFACELGQYLPDFRVRVPLGDGEGSPVCPVYIEVKPSWSSADLEQQSVNGIIVAKGSQSGPHVFGLAIKDDGASFPTLWQPVGSFWMPMVWGFVDGVPGLVSPLADAPWPDGYWKAGR